jgi:hypothetical protein
LKTKKKLAITLLAILCLPVCANATDITFATNGTISGTDNYTGVTVQNNGTTISMFGGQVGYLHMRDASTFNMSGGQINGFIFTSNTSTFNLSDGTLNVAGGFEFDGNVNISGGNITGWGKFANSPYYGGVVNITGGNLNFSSLMPYGELNIHGGLLNIGNYAWSGGTTNIFGYGFNYDSVGQVLTGYLSDHNQFTINQVSSFDYQHINLVPEPVSLCFLVLGGVLLRLNK